jgi:hypothetical protein
MNLLQRASWRLMTSYKVNKLRTRFHAAMHPCDDPRLVFIFGCQRSGTTMLRNFIGFDPRVSDYGEGDPPYFWQTPTEDPRYIRLVPDAEVEALRQAEKSEIVLIKPLHDSQRAAELLSNWPGSKGVWIFRHYREVILSHLTYYRGRYEPMPYLRDLLELNTASWKAESLGEEMQDFIREHRHLATTPTAGFALFWLARNSLLFDNAHPALIALHYADLVRHPRDSLRILGNHLNVAFNERYSDFPEQRDREKPLPNELPAVLHEACEAMMSRLLQAASPMQD